MPVHGGGEGLELARRGPALRMRKCAVPRKAEPPHAHTPEFRTRWSATPRREMILILDTGREVFRGQRTTPSGSGGSSPGHVSARTRSRTRTVERQDDMPSDRPPLAHSRHKLSLHCRHVKCLASRLRHGCQPPSSEHCCEEQENGAESRGRKGVPVYRLSRQ